MTAAIQSKQGSALALGTVQAGKRECIYMGQTALPGTDVEISPVGRETIFDLASLTKALVTVPLTIEAKEHGLLDWEDPVTKFIPEFPGRDVTLTDLLRHRSGLKAHEEFYRRPSAQSRGYIEPQEIRSWICESKREPLSSAQVVYSDLGILLLGMVLEKVFQAPLAQSFEEQIRRPLGLVRTGFRILPHAPKSLQPLRLEAPKNQFVATAHCSFHKRTLQGEVDDNNCWGLGGATAHAGLFSTLEETLFLLEFSLELAKRHRSFFFANAEDRPPFTRGYMLYPGLRPSPTSEWKGAIGHTGFVGTSAWYHDPQKMFIVLLGNRVHPSREDTRFVQTRLDIHHALWNKDLGLTDR